LLGLRYKEVREAKEGLTEGRHPPKLETTTRAKNDSRQLFLEIYALSDRLLIPKDELKMKTSPQNTSCLLRQEQWLD
jgi:hypothetical protein